VTSLTLPDGAVEQWSYLGTGQTSGYTSPLGYTNAYVFDDAGQMTMVNYPAGTDTTFAYDASGRHTQMVDSTGTTTYTYNAAGELTSLAQPQGTTTYTYNVAGQRLTMNEAGSGTTSYSYDTAGRLASLVNPFSETTSFVYDTLGRVGQKSLANGTSEHYAYDTRSRLTQVQLKQGATVLRTTGYAWDNADQITSQTVNGVTTNYGYDLAGQLTSEIRSGYNVAYTYDANGNRLSKTVNGVAEGYTYDLADKMLTAGAKSYTYDAAGRTVGINAPGGTTTLTYDYESRVTAISGPGINETHTYNGLDTRVGTVQGGVSRTFVRDGSYVTDPVLRDGQATYTPGVSERRGGVSTWSHSGLKNADAQTTSVGAIAATRVYDAFGAELSATGTWKGPFGYAGGFGYQEDSSGLKLLGHRYYDASTGRFLSRDPIKDGRNWYVYCANKPIRFVDPTGLAAWEGNLGFSGAYAVGADYSVNIRYDDVSGEMTIGQEIGGSFGTMIGAGPSVGGKYDPKGRVGTNAQSGGGTKQWGDINPDEMVYSLVMVSVTQALEDSSLGGNLEGDVDTGGNGGQVKPQLGLAMRWVIVKGDFNANTYIRNLVRGTTALANEASYMWDQLRDFRVYENGIDRLRRRIAWE